MGFIDWLFRRPSNESFTFLKGYEVLMSGGTTSGKIVNQQTSMQMPAVYSCVRILAEAIASLPFYVYRVMDTGRRERVLGHPLYALLHDDPNPEITSFIFRETLMTHLLL